MEIHRIKYFLSVAKTGSFTKAAKACLVSQPSLSVQIALLEQELGGVLFERGKQGAKLTQRGKLFQTNAAEIMRLIERNKEELASLDQLDIGQVTLGCLPITGAHLLPPVLRSFKEKYPAIRVELREASSPGLAAELRAGEVDLAVLDDAGLGKGLEHLSLFSEPLDLALPPQHALAKRKQVSLASLGDESFIVMKPGHGFRSIVDGAFKKAKIDPSIVFESGEIETVQSMVSAGLGVALVPRMVRKTGGPVYVNLNAPAPKRTLYLACRKKIVLSPAAERLRTEMISLLKRKTDTRSRQ